MTGAVKTAAPVITPEMVAAGTKAAREHLAETGGNDPAVIYRAMYGARPDADSELTQALQMLAGLHPCITCDWDRPLEVAATIFDAVLAERRELERSNAATLHSLNITHRLYRESLKGQTALEPDANRWKYVSRQMHWADQLDGTIKWVASIPMAPPDVSAVRLRAGSVHAELDAAVDVALQAGGAAC